MSEATLGVWAYETLLCVYLLQKSANHHQAIYLHQLSANWSNISIYPSLKVNYFECVPDCMVLCVSRACLLPGSKQLILPSLFFFNAAEIHSQTGPSEDEMLSVL